MAQAAGTANAETVYQDVRRKIVAARKQFAEFNAERAHRRLYLSRDWADRALSRNVTCKIVVLDTEVDVIAANR